MGMIQLPETSIAFFKANIDKIFETGHLAEGPWNEALSGFVADCTNVKIAVPTVSNGSGLMALLQLYKKKDNRTRVLLQSNTMYGVKTLVYSAGLDVMGYIKCDMNTLMPSFSDVQEAIQNTKDKSNLVILLSHIGGIINPDIEKIATLCKENNIILLEDCAHSFGATYNGKHSGSFGDAGVYSFYATKAIPAGEGGVVVTNDEEIGSDLVNYVKYDRFTQKLNLGVNIRQSEIQALLVYSVVKDYEAIIEDKTRTASFYIETCNELDIPFIVQNDESQKGNYYKFIVLSRSGDITIDLPNLQTTTSKVYDYCLGESKIIATCHACLPIWYKQDEDVVYKVINELRASKKRN
jgi:perosamine synthetase